VLGEFRDCPQCRAEFMSHIARHRLDE
jgi:hypothetical protein